MFGQGDAAGRLIAIAMLALAAGFAAVMFVHANADPDLLWQGYYHDRNGHYSFGQDLALAIRTGDPLWFLSELEKAKVWPPLHGLVAGHGPQPGTRFGEKTRNIVGSVSGRCCRPFFLRWETPGTSRSRACL